jgi:intermediate peptidase
MYPTTLPTRSLSLLVLAVHLHVYNMIRSITSLPLRPSYSRRILATRFSGRSSTRSLNTAASRIARPPPPVYHKAQDDSHDLRQLFDHAQTSTPPTSSQTTGLFDYPVKTPYALRPLTERTLIHCQAIVDRICNSPGDPSEMRRVVKNLDRLSDVLCGVIDMCELLRTVHPDPEWVEECEQAYARLCNFMNELNTHPGMYEVSLYWLLSTIPLTP